MAEWNGALTERTRDLANGYYVSSIPCNNPDPKDDILTKNDKSLCSSNGAQISTPSSSLVLTSPPKPSWHRPAGSQGIDQSGIRKTQQNVDTRLINYDSKQTTRLGAQPIGGPAIAGKLPAKETTFNQHEGEIQTAVAPSGSQSHKHHSSLDAPASQDGVSPCPQSPAKGTNHRVDDLHWTIPQPRHPQMETLTEPGVVPHRHRPISNPGYFPKQEVSGNFFFPGATNSQHNYPRFLPRGGSTGGRLDAEEARDMPYSSQRFASRDDMNREADITSSDFVGVPSQSPSLMSPYRQHQTASHHMSRFSRQEDDGDLNGSRDENLRGGDPAINSREKLDLSSSPDKRPGFDPSPKDTSFEDANIHTPGYHKKGDRSMGYAPDDRRPASFGQPVYPGMRESVKGIYDSLDRNHQGGDDKPEAVPIAYDNDDNEATRTGNQRHHHQQFRGKLNHRSSHDPVSFWNASASQEYGHHGSNDLRPRAMTMDSSLHDRRETGPTSPYRGALYPSRSNDHMFNRMREHMNQAAMKNHYFYPDREKDRESPMHPHTSMANHFRRSTSVEGRPSRQEMINRMMMMSPEKLSKDIMSAYPQSSQSFPFSQRQQDAFYRMPSGPATSPGIRKPQDAEDRMNSPAKPVVPNEHQFHPLRPTDSSPLGAKAPSTPQMNSSDTGAALGDQPRPPSSPQSSRQLNSTTPPKTTSSNFSSKYETNDGTIYSENESPKVPQPDSTKDATMEDRDYFPGSNSSDPLKVSQQPVYPSFMSPKDEHSFNSIRKFPTDSMNKAQGESSSRHGLMPKKEVMSDDMEEDSFQGSCPSPTQHSQRPISYPAMPPQPFFPSPMRAPAQTHAFMSLRGPQDQLPGTPTFPFDKDLASRFPLPGMGPEIPMPPRMGPGPGPTFMGPMPSSMGDDKDVYFCHLCSYSGKSKPEFDTHMGIHFEYNCPHCDYTSRTEGRLKRHIKDFHTDDSARRSMPGRPKVFKCKQCSFSATEKDKFWEHARSHIKEDKLLQCPKCPFVTEYKHHLEYHLRNHFGSKPFKCTKCNYSCVNKSMLNSHMKSHTNVYQYRCSDCTYATKYCHSLKLHLRKYNHKPATVLNQDGSLPHGLDVDSSGLSVVAKRGPPRGPRGPRKDKNDPYLSQLYGMPPVPLGMAPNVNPMLKGMMPFWPVMHQSGLPGPHGHPRMLPGISSLAHHMTGGIEEEGDRQERLGMGSSSGDMNESLSDESNPMKEDDDEERGISLPCRLCDFIGDSTESLCLHLLQVHKDKTGDMAEMYGISESALSESIERAKMRKERRISEPSMDSFKEDPDSEFHRRNTIAGLLSRNSYHGQTGSDIDQEEGTRTYPSWASTFSSNAKMKSLGQDMSYFDDGNEEDHLDAGPTGGMDILQQMTLKFGDGAIGEKRHLPENVEGNTTDKDEKQSQEDNKTDASVISSRKSLKEIPLDLTKPKSVSPPMFSNPSSPKRDDDEDDDSRLPWMDEGRQGDLNSITEKLYRKRQLSETEEMSSSPAVNTSTPEGPPMVPRKRSRKGKAYKLDTICMKLQERQSKSPIDSDDTDSEMDMNFEKFQPLQEKLDSDKVNVTNDLKDSTSIPDTGEEEENKEKAGENNEPNLKEGRDNPNHDGDETETKEETDQLKDEMETLKDIADSTQEDIKDIDKEEEKCIGSDNDLENDDQSKSDSVEENAPSAQTVRVEDEAQKEFETLQQTLSILNKEMEEENKQINDGNEDDDDDDKTVENDEVESIRSPSGDESEQPFSMDLVSVNTNDVFNLSDKENSNDGVSLGNDASKSSENIEIEDKVDMINTVLENRKKPLPPAVRRGTELAWKLLNDPVNPVTSIPIPAQSPPLGSKPQQMSPIASGSTTAPALLPNSLPSPIRNGINMVPTPPHPPPPHPIMPLKPPLPVPLPPTPMAFIPPTNRMMPESPMPRLPPTTAKPMPKDMYECTYCDLSFRDCVMYTVHMGYHSNRNPFKCNSCGIICRDKVEFFLHIARSPHS